jgi:hypothetical protein
MVKPFSPVLRDHHLPDVLYTCSSIIVLPRICLHVGGDSNREKNLLRECNAISRGRAMAEAVSRLSLTAKTRVQCQATSCGIYGGQSGTGSGFCSRASVFLCHYHSTNAAHSFIHVSSTVHNLGNRQRR